MSGFRLPQGGLIDRDRSLRFSFDGKSYRGHPGDTLASALLASGVRLVGRSFKYHRPRGILSAGPEEPNALVELGRGARREPNSRATLVELYDGLIAVSQNRFPSLRFDLMSMNTLLAPLLSAGFYYKTFMWPASFWEKFYEPMIRRAAGLGRAATEPDPDAYENATAFCDVLVIGAGPAGLAAALAAGRSGARVILCEQDRVLGGRLHDDRHPEVGWADRAEAELAALPEVTIMRRTQVFGVYDGGTYAALERVADHLLVPPPGLPRQRLWRIIARRCILAAGAIERPLVFDGNDRPGVMLAGAVRSYINRYGVAPGRRAVVFANNDSALATLADLTRAGVRVAALVDSRPQPGAGAEAAAAAAGAEFLSGAVVCGTSGGQGLRAVTVAGADGARRRISCDLLAISGGWNPSVQLATHHGGRPVWDETIAALVPGATPPGMSVVGAAAGQFTTQTAWSEGAQAGIATAAAGGFAAAPLELPAAPLESTAIVPLWQVAGAGGTAFVDFQNDVTVKDIRLAKQEGFHAVEHLKRYTTLGMATDQGKTSNVNALAIMAGLTGRSIAETGTTLLRPPVQPVAIGALAGQHRGREFRPVRLPPTHRWAEGLGAVFIDAGQWLRAQWYPRPGEDWQASVNREVRAVREKVGICDVTTLGKIDLQGTDVAEFLELVYANGWKNLPVGRARYGLMLREDGFVLDDGTTARLGEQHYVMTTTTVNAGRVMQHLEFCHQVLWPEADVQMISVTDQWAQLAVAGPNSRALLRRIVDPEFDLGNQALPYMGAAAITICGGQKARLFRLSFSGELAYEIAAPARFGDSLARVLMEQGGDLGVTPYGTEALGVLRIEKGHPAGPELNGQTTAHDLGMAKLLSKRKDFIGRAMAARPALTDTARPGLAGFRPVDPAAIIPAGAHLLRQGVAAIAAEDLGWITSAVYSATFGGWIALGMVAGGAARIGETLRAYDPLRGHDIPVTVTAPVFYDAAGERLHG